MPIGGLGRTDAIPEAMLLSVLDAFDDPVAVTTAVRDREGRILDFRIEFVNAAACHWAGLSREQIIGRIVGDLLPNFRESGLFDVMTSVVDTGESVERSGLAYQDTIAGGHRISGVFDLRSVRLGDGYVSIWRDVAECERTAAELARSTELLRAIVDSSPFATMAFDADQKLVVWSDGAERLFGWRADEVIGQPPPIEMIPVEERDDSQARIRRTLGGATIAAERVRRLTRDGREVSVEIHAGPLRAADGRSIGYAGQMVDVTRVQEMEGDFAMLGRVGAIFAAAVNDPAARGSILVAAQALCDQLHLLPAVDFAALGALDGDDIVILASSAAADCPLAAGERLPGHRALNMQARSSDGPWANYWESIPADGEWGRRMDAAGMRGFAIGPMVHGDHVDGGLVIGTRDESFARTLVEKWSSLVDFTTTPRALLADSLHDWRERASGRRAIGELIEQRAFHPVFQPIVDLGTGAVVGHEALSRFDSGEPPETVFAAAWAAGLGPKLELATLEAAVEAAKRLPSGRWLDLNVTPRLLAHADDLRAVLHRADRAIVLEVTEHEVVEDYTAFLKAVRSLGHDIRLAVDDAGAGVANFAHIIDLGPDFVKLDTSLVRRVNAHLGRQALIVGMRHFSRTSGCRLVAEGIETGDEARTLAELGVEFGQGYWFGRPEPVS